MDISPTPPNVPQLVDDYVLAEMEQEQRYSNRTPLDESGIFSLHQLTARIYACGYDDGARAEAEKSRATRVRENLRNEKKETP